MDLSKTGKNIIDHFVNSVIRPPRAEYIPDDRLRELEFSVAGRNFKRQDLELINGRGHTLQCSHYIPETFLKDESFPCVVYCHGNSGCRADANDAAAILLPLDITVFTLDFSGSGLSGGEYVSLGWHEKSDLTAVVSYLRSIKQISHIGLWGRSMGAVTSLLYGADDPSIAAMVLDSAFANLYDLMIELAYANKIGLPKFMVRMTIRYMRRIIMKKAKFDIMNLNVVQFAAKTYIPALFGHATEDTFILPHHSDLIYKSYEGYKNIIKFEGNHNTPRPSFYYASVAMFFKNALHPRMSSSKSEGLEKCHDMGDPRCAVMDEETEIGCSEDFCSASSSNQERGTGDEQPTVDCRSHQVIPSELGSPTREAATVVSKNSKLKKSSLAPKKPKREALLAVRQHFRLCICRRVHHKRNASS